MNSKICKRCGSSNLIADRALAGRIVCGRCGSKDITSKIQLNAKYIIGNRYMTFILLFITITFIIIISS